MESQGYEIEDNILFQDNKNAMLLKKWENIQFKKKQTYQGSKVVQPNTDILTKPMQGCQFRLMRSMLMKCPIEYDEMSTMQNDENRMMMHENKSMISSKECVEQLTKCHQ